MTKLQAVNKMLHAIGEHPVAALDTGGTSTEAIAELVLDRHDEQIQSKGWHENTEVDIEMVPADVQKMAMVIAAGSWAPTTKTLTKVAAFANYTWARGDQIYVSAGTGITVAWYEIASRVSDDAITLVESLTTGTPADVATTIIGWESAIKLTSDILKVDSCGVSLAKDVTKRETNLWDRDNNTFTFDANVTIEIVRQLDFTDLTGELSRYIVAHATKEFQRREVGSVVQDEFLDGELATAKGEVMKMDGENTDHNILSTVHAQRVTGRSTVPHPLR